MDYHYSVLAKEAIDLLNIKRDGIYVDATLGHGGHALEIIKKGGVVFGIDQDPKNLEIASERIKKEGFEEKFFPIHSNFNRLEKIVKTKINQKIDGLVIDLGLSSNQQKSQGRGFSFNDLESLDMRLDPTHQNVTAEMIINTASFDDLYKIFTKYGQELRSKPLILRIIRERQKSPIKTGERLANIIRDYYKEHRYPTKIDPSTKIFMSLRIVVNDEFNNLKKLLDHTLTVIKPGGRVCVITFHSGEDRIVKQFIQKLSSQKLIEPVSKAIKPSYIEIKANPLSRSSLLRSYKII
jgi:16S rRNA (cytosine1402-N4)-methyltransferase